MLFLFLLLALLVTSSADKDMLRFSLVTGLLWGWWSQRQENLRAAQEREEGRLERWRLQSQLKQLSQQLQTLQGERSGGDEEPKSATNPSEPARSEREGTQPSLFEGVGVEPIALQAEREGAPEKTELLEYGASLKDRYLGDDEEEERSKASPLGAQEDPDKGGALSGAGERIEREDDHRADKNGTPAEPDEPPSSQWLSALLEDLLRGSLITRIGGLLLLLGVSALLRYVARRYEPSLMSLHLFAALGAAGLVAVGWLLAQRGRPRRAAALATQGAGLSLAALTLISAARIYQLTSLLFGFMGLALISALGVTLALRQRSAGLALTSFLGAFIAPLLFPLSALAELDSYPLLLAYDSLLNAAILWLAVRASWRSLNLLGFIATSAALLAWAEALSELSGASARWPIQLSLLVTIGLTGASTLAHSLRRSSRLRGWLDGALWWGTPSLVVAVEVELYPDDLRPAGVAIALLAPVYLSLALARRRARAREDAPRLEGLLLLLTASCAALSVTLLAGLQAGLITTGVEGLGIAWLALHQRERRPLLIGALSLTVALIVSAARLDSGGTPPLLQEACTLLALSLLMLTLAGLLTAQRRALQPLLLLGAGADAATWLGGLALLWSLRCALWSSGLSLEHAALLSLSFTLPLLKWRGARRSWPTLVAFARWCAPLTALLLIRGWHGEGIDEGIFWGGGLKRWESIALLTLGLGSLALLCRQRKGMEEEGAAHPHTAARLSLFVPALAWSSLELAELGAALSGSALAQALRWVTLSLPLAALLGAPRARSVPGDVQGRSRRSRPPLLTRLLFPHWHRAPSLQLLSAPLAILIGCGSLSLSLTRAAQSGLYLPLLNPVDLAQLSCLILLTRWYQSPRRALGAWTRWPLSALYLLALNLCLLRAAVAWGATSFSWAGFWEHDALQGIVAISWGALSLWLMRWGSVTRTRRRWWSGLALLGLTCGKLALIDAQLSDPLGQIISFLGVGALMLLVGYWAPAPSPGEGEIKD